MMATVSRETLGERRSVSSRPYRSGFRTEKASRTATRIREAALGLIAEGNFRPSLHEVAARAEVGPGRINAHYGYIHLLWRVLAREHTDEVADAASLPSALSDDARTRLVWLIMTGERRT